jgi:hypothetical protein
MTLGKILWKLRGGDMAIRKITYGFGLVEGCGKTGRIQNSPERVISRQGR